MSGGRNRHVKRGDLHQRLARFQGIQYTAPNDRKQIGRIETGLRKEPAISRPILQLASAGTQEPRDRMAAQADQLAEKGRFRPPPGGVSLERAAALVPQALDFRSGVRTLFLDPRRPWFSKSIPLSVSSVVKEDFLTPPRCAARSRPKTSLGVARMTSRYDLTGGPRGTVVFQVYSPLRVLRGERGLPHAPQILSSALTKRRSTSHFALSASGTAQRLRSSSGSSCRSKNSPYSWSR